MTPKNSTWDVLTLTAIAIRDRPNICKYGTHTFDTLTPIEINYITKE